MKCSSKAVYRNIPSLWTIQHQRKVLFRQRGFGHTLNIFRRKREIPLRQGVPHTCNEEDPTYRASRRTPPEGLLGGGVFTLQIRKLWRLRYPLYPLQVRKRPGLHIFLLCLGILMPILTDSTAFDKGLTLAPSATVIPAILNAILPLYVCSKKS